MDASFSVEDLNALSRLVIESWSTGSHLDWSVPAGTLDWSCHATADHVVDCVFSYALFLASRKQDGYPNFGELHALPGATPADLVEGLRAVTTMLSAVISTAPVDTRAVIWRRPSVQTGTPQEFAVRGALEMVLHAYDISTGLGVPFHPPRDICARLLQDTGNTPGSHPFEATEDPWSDLLARSGRPRPKE